MEKEEVIIPKPLSVMLSQSSDIGKLFEALGKAQAEIRPAVMDMKNPHYGSRYASLTSCQEVYRYPLSRYGLALAQQVYSTDEGYFLRSILAHSSGQWISNTFKLLLDKQNMQGLGSAITYARRYGANSLIGVVDTEDDDGNAAATPPPEPKQSSPIAPPSPVKPAIQTKVPDSQVLKPRELLSIAMKQFGWSNEDLLNHLKYNYEVNLASELKPHEFAELMEHINSGRHPRTHK